MKRVLIVFAAFITLSCTNDTTESVGSATQSFMAGTSITLSLENSRTQLGNKAGENYPLYWSEGDKISANGIESDKAVIKGDNPALATFNFDYELTGSYNIAYPSAPEGKVIFAKEQTHTNNSTFGNGVATMYGIATSERVELKHLTGVLKFGIVGSATLNKIEVSTADYTPIAGIFDIDFESGAITPTANVTNTITYSFGNGLKLNSKTPTYAHIALPAGEYSLLRVQLYDNKGGIMLVEARASSNKPLQAGVVREFSKSITYKADSAANVEEGKALPLWEEGYLDIHFINTGRGECIFHILPDGTTLLVDGGEIATSSISVPQRPNESVRPYITYARYIKNFMPLNKVAIDYCLATHLHTDHIGSTKCATETAPAGYPKSGLLSLFDEVPYKTVLDSMYPSYESYEITGSFSTSWVKFVNWGVSNNKFTALQFTPGEEQITLVNRPTLYNNFSILNLCANGLVYYKYNDEIGVYGDFVIGSDNNASCGFHLKYGNFDYISCGDLVSSGQNRVAYYFRDFIGEGNLDAFKCHHHLANNSWGGGMERSNFNPRIILNHCFASNKPNPEKLAQALSVSEAFFATNIHRDIIASNGELVEQITDYNGHIVLRVSPGGGRFYVYMLDDKNFEYRVKSIHGPYTSK